MRSPKPMANQKIPAALRALVLDWARRPDVHSISCPFEDPELWRGLLIEQVRRAQATGRPPRDAFGLFGPDSGIFGVAKLYAALEDLDDPNSAFDGSTLEEQIGGEIHIPYEGLCGADFLIYPKWRKFNPAAWNDEGADLDSATFGKPCNHLLVQVDAGEPTCATRSGPVAGWWLYSSRAPYKDCNFRHRPRRSQPPDPA